MVLPVAALLAAGLAGLSPSAAHAAAPARSGDFDGDTYRDLAVGGPTMTVGQVARAGAVGVAYGSASGLDTGRHQTISQASAGVPGAAEGGDRFGAAVASGDFDGDGYADLAVGSPGETVGTAEAAGSVTVVYGSGSGLSGRSAVFNQGSGGVPGTLGDFTGFGGTLAAGDVNGDGRADLAARATAKANDRDDQVIVLYGGPDGLTGTNATSLNRPPDDDFPGGEDWSWTVTDFGVGLAVADVDADGTGDVVSSSYIWSDEEPEPGIRGPAPALSYYTGGAGGVTPTRARSLPQIGGTLATGDVNGDGTADVAAGFSGGEFRPSRVSVLLGGTGGPRLDTTFNQDTAGVPGSDEYGDDFGAAVALGDVTGDGRADLVVGAPGEDGATIGQGRVTFLRGGATGLSFTGASYLDEQSAGVPGTGEQGDRFGAGVTLADHGADGHADLSAGAANENGNGDKWSPDGDGSVTLLPGTASGPGTTGARLFGAATLGGVTANANFGDPLLLP